MSQFTAQQLKPLLLASLASQPKTLSITTLSSLAVIVAGTLSYTTSAWANCTSADSVNYVCAGATASTQTISGSNLNVSIDSTFSANLTSGHVVDVTNASGAVSISSSGTYSNTGGVGGGSGMSLLQNGNGLVTVNQIAGSVAGYDNAIYVVNDGIGSATQITTAANLTAQANYAIDFYGTTNAGDATIQQTAGTLWGNHYGIAAGDWI